MLLQFTKVSIHFKTTCSDKYRMKVKSDHRSKFSNLSIWKGEA